MLQIITKFNSSIPSVRKVKNWLLNDPFHVWHGRDRLVVFFILAGDEAANAFLPLPDGDFSVEDESIRAILESTYQQVYLKLCKLLDNLDDLNLQAESFAEEDEFHFDLKNQILLLHDKLLDFINDVFVWRDHKEMGNYLGEIQSYKNTNYIVVMFICIQILLLYSIRYLVDN